jgi:ABC-type multidrug transport system fused ATPase/permease subunit
MSETLSRIRALLSAAERRSAILLIGLMAIGMAMEMLATFLVIPAIALLMQQDLAETYPRFKPLLDFLGNPSQAELILKVMLGLVAVYFVKNAFQAYLAWNQTRLAFHVQARLSQRLFAVYLRQPYTFHLQRNSAELIRNVMTETSMFAHAIVNALNIATEALALLGISALLLFVEPVGTLIAALVLGISAWAFHRLMRMRLVRWGETRQFHDGLRMQHLRQGLGGAKDVKLLGREATFLDAFQTHNMRSAQVSQYQAMSQMLPRLWLELLAVAGLATLVIAMLAQGREMAAVMPTLGLFAAAAFRLMPSVNRVLNSLQVLRYCMPVVDVLHDELKLAPSSLPTPSGAIAGLASDIRLDGVCYTYPTSAAPALDGVSLAVRRGESVGFVGPSGSGKSTLIDVVLGLLTPQKGQVLVDGADIQSDLRAWQDQIGYVPQSIYLTDDTLRRNVAFGLPDDAIDEAAARRAIRAAQLEEFVAGLPQGLDTLVGERGVRLSGGQRQRIGIARALYHDPAVLVLDEATSALDTATESGVMEAVTALHGSKTVLIVAHRLSTVAHCDRLYRLEQGRAAAQPVPSPAPAAAGALR